MPNIEDPVKLDQTAPKRPPRFGNLNIGWRHEGSEMGIIDLQRVPLRPEGTTGASRVDGCHDISDLLTLGLPRQRLKQKRSVAIATGTHAAVTQLLREMKLRCGMTDAAIARVMGISKQAVNEASNSYKTCDHKRRPSFQWIVQYAHACGCRILVEFPGANDKANT
mgnify:CR=1 FL=1